MKKKILIISGATASGKSGLALEVARKVNEKARIINADSIQLYKELPILSSQPSKNELSQIEHRLYSILTYQDEFSLNDWLELVKKEIDLAFAENKLPIVVGGTGLYLSKLIDGINEIPKIENEVRKYCLDYLEKFGKSGLISELKRLGDEEEKVKTLDKQRLLRRLEIIKQTGKTLSYWQSLPTKQFYDQDCFIHINLNPAREILYYNCNERFVKMLTNGAIEEVKNFMNIELTSRNSIAKTLGLAEIRDYILGNLSKTEMIELASQKTRNYAKRQLTWFRHQFQNKIEITNVSHETIQLIIHHLTQL